MSANFHPAIFRLGRRGLETTLQIPPSFAGGNRKVENEKKKSSSFLLLLLRTFIFPPLDAREKERKKKVGGEKTAVEEKLFPPFLVFSSNSLSFFSGKLQQAANYFFPRKEK